MQNVKNSYPYRLILIGFIVVGIVVGCILGYMFVVLDEVGAFSKASWELLDSPLKFQHIVDATTRKV